MAGKRKKETEDPSRGVSRRGFITAIGAGAVGAAAAGRASGAPEIVRPAGKGVEATLRINGRTHVLPVEPRWSLLYVLRDRLGMTGTKVGCDRGECGACTVLIDGVPRYACMTLALEAEGHEITTIEAMGSARSLGAVERAFVEEDAFQCGYCTPGQVMAAEALLRATPEPTLEQIQTGMSGNLCRCGNYAHIFKAVKKAAALRKAEGGVR